LGQTVNSRQRRGGSENMDGAEARLAAINSLIGGAAKLIAVSKTFAAEEVEPVLAAGQRDFGENRVQEAQRKWPQLREKYPDVRLHLIGPLQSNKVRDALQLFDVIHSVDRDKLAAALAAARRTAPTGAWRTRSFLVQVNTGEEPQKAGVPPADAVDFVRRCRELHNLPIDGLMCIPPAEDDPSPHFGTLRDLARQAGVAELSMGMSGDFETAIAHGATYVRIGSAIFGARD
jgi:PLP dependent protein